MAMSIVIAFSNAAFVAIDFGSAAASPSVYQRRTRSITVAPARSKMARRSVWVATMVDMPGSVSPRASVRQAIEFAVNKPAHEPHVGQAASSMIARSSSEIESSTAAVMAEINCSRSRLLPSDMTAEPPSIGPAKTKTVGTFKRNIAISIPGVILSQAVMQTSASAQWALAMYSTESATRSRDGSE